MMRILIPVLLSTLEILAVRSAVQAQSQTGPAPAQQTAPTTPGQPESPEPLRRVRRAARPEFEPGAGRDVFFADLFADALSGGRPASVNASPETLAAPVAIAENVTPESGDSWSSLISASVLEDEIKRQQIRLNGLITNPGQFQTRNGEIRDSFQILAMVFAIISQYDDAVRWQDQAESAMTVLAAAAARATKTDPAAFEIARDSTQRLTDLVRGGNFGREPNTRPVSDWSAVIDRTALMQRLDHFVSQSLKTAAATRDSFADDAELVLHDAELIAAMGRILQLPDSMDSDDEEYRDLAEQMIQAAQALSSATRQNDYEAALTRLNQLNQSCADCHADWR